MAWSSYDRAMATITAVLGERLADAFNYAESCRENPDAVRTLPAHNALCLLLLHSLIIEDAGTAVIALNLLIMTENSEYKNLLSDLCQEFGFDAAELQKAHVFAANIPVLGVKAIFSEIAAILTKESAVVIVESSKTGSESNSSIHHQGCTCKEENCSKLKKLTLEQLKQLKELGIHPVKRLRVSVNFGERRKVRKKTLSDLVDLHTTDLNIFNEGGNPGDFKAIELDCGSQTKTCWPSDGARNYTRVPPTRSRQRTKEALGSHKIGVEEMRYAELHTFEIEDCVPSDDEIELDINDKLINTIQSLACPVPKNRLLILGEQAIRIGNTTACRLLRRKGLQLSWCFGRERYTCLHLAAKHGHEELVKYILKYRVPLDVRTKGGGWTPLVLAVESSQVAIVKLLAGLGADLYARDFKLQRTPLHWAAWYNIVEIAKFLLDHSEAHLLKDINGNTPLDLCRRWGYVQMEELILQKLNSVSMN